MTVMYKILIVEDDGIITAALVNALRQWGCEAEGVADFQDVFAQFMRQAPHLVLLDISLPFFNGYYWCEKIRQVSKAPIIFISSASDNLNLVMALNMGADDFIAKPFELDVVIAKVQALLRRTYAFGGQMHVIEHKGAVLNLNDASLLVEDKKVELTKNEFRIMQLLMENKGRTVSRDTIMQRLWESDSYIDDNTLTVNVTRLRRKLTDAGLPGFIVTQKGRGYLVEA